ncbi:unnamed protein product, partial [marine sediment metagenome]
KGVLSKPTTTNLGSSSTFAIPSRIKFAFK